MRRINLLRRVTDGSLAQKRRDANLDALHSAASDWNRKIVDRPAVPEIVLEGSQFAHFDETGCFVESDDADKIAGEDLKHERECALKSRDFFEAIDHVIDAVLDTPAKQDFSLEVDGQVIAIKAGEIPRSRLPDNPRGIFFGLSDAT